MLLLFITYVKYNPKLGKYYVGMSSGWVWEINEATIGKILTRRDSGHHKNKEGYEKANLDRFSTKKEAVRGREQMVQDALKQNEVCGNTNNSISERNKKRALYMAAALELFGEVKLTLAYMLSVSMF
jgi:hypothetical protein